MCTAEGKNRRYESRDRIGYIFQGFNLFPALTALENVEATLNLKGYRGGGARDEAATFWGVFD